VFVDVSVETLTTVKENFQGVHDFRSGDISYERVKIKSKVKQSRYTP
jgi:hypothetical protein